jgi:hypothetical protein
MIKKLISFKYLTILNNILDKGDKMKDNKKMEKEIEKLNWKLKFEV